MKPSLTKVVLILGNPNSGKSLLFNRLTGLRQKVANFPGVTVEIATGQSTELGAQLVDFPGIYSLKPLTRDEEVASENLNAYIKSGTVHAIICILDITRLDRSLFLALQLQQLCAKEGLRIIYAMNMMDQISQRKITLNTSLLEDHLGVRVVEISAKASRDFHKLKEALYNSRPLNTSSGIQADTNQLKALAKDLSNRIGLKGDMLLRTQYRIDRVILSNIWGALIFGLVMLFLFQAIFSWSAPLMDGIESLLARLSNFCTGHLPEGIWQEIIRNPLFGGLGSFLVFVPQIFVLTLVISALEDSGYLARATLICHRPLAVFGLSGKSFVSLLTGHACAIPAIFSTRSIESPKKRFITIMIVPLMACSARLPIYGLLITTLIPAKTIMGGLLGLRGLCFFVLYLFGIFTALAVAAFLDRCLAKDMSDSPFILELPPYRLPDIPSVLRKSIDRSWSFLTRAGPTIFMVSLVIWALGYFPNHGTLEHSYLAFVGHWIEPVFRPLGLDWKFGVAVVTSFLAREVFVGTLGTMLGIAGADQDFRGLAHQLNGIGFTFASGIALLVFYAIAMQCAATLAVIKKEYGSWKIPTILFVAYGALAYFLASITYHILR